MNMSMSMDTATTALNHDSIANHTQQESSSQVEGPATLDHRNFNIDNVVTEERGGDQWNIEEARRSLRHAVHMLSKRGLNVASKWAAEQLIGLAPLVSSHNNSKSNKQKFNFEESHEEENFGEEDKIKDLEWYAKSIMDMGENHRAAAVLSVSSEDSAKMAVPPPMRGGGVAFARGDFPINPPLKNLTAFGIYLRAYAIYMAGERRKEEEILELRDPLERTSLRNANLPQLASELYDYYNSHALDAFGLYIYGVVLKEIQKSPSSKFSPRTTIFHDKLDVAPTPQSILIQSLVQYPCNWSAWLDLAELCVTDQTIYPQVEHLLKPISSHWMYHFFCAHLFLENEEKENAIMVMDRLIQGTDEEYGGGFFVQSPYLQSQLAIAHYKMSDFETAQNHFLSLSVSDPQRLDQMDVYANILYVKEDKVALSQLAHRAVKIDKYRPETCCIVGNYYSLKSQHEKAVQYFQRALKLDRTYMSAWTLMGHEYIEMKNTPAAIEAYRRAVDINPKDYRAWYGLGQTYEIMNMLLYALFYYRKVVELRPYDARMWCAMGVCYLGLEKRNDAIRSFERAVAYNDEEGIATKELATLYREDGNVEQAARCYLRHLELKFQAQLNQPPPDLGGNAMEAIISSVKVDEPEAEALLFLAFYHRDHGEFDLASMCCSRLLDYPGPEKEQGKALLREIRAKDDKKSSSWAFKSQNVERDESFEFSP